MKNIFILFGLITALLANDSPKLTIKISNIEKIKGEIKVGVFNTDTHFLKEGYAIKNYSIKVENNTAILRINDLPKGEYAITMYHDQNSDNECNRNFIGIPKEPYGFSYNIKPKMSAPKYEDCKFKLDENITLHIKMIN